MRHGQRPDRPAAAGVSSGNVTSCHVAGSDCTAMALRILHVSDSHLGPGVPYADEHWAAVVAHVASTRPDLVVHSGDLSVNGANGRADLAHSRARLDDLSVPWLALPGN